LRWRGERRASPSQPGFLFIHVPKTGGSSLIGMLREYCQGEYVTDRWKDDSTSSGIQHRSFHATAHSYIQHYGRDAFDNAYTFAIVRHPFAKQVSNFFFLLNQCEQSPKRCESGRNERLIPYDKISTASSSDEEKVQAFHEWIAKLYEAYPPGSPQHYLFGNKGHGNEEYSTFNSTQTSWMVDESGEKIVVKEIFHLENLAFDKLSDAIPCLSSSSKLTTKNQTPQYPPLSSFRGNERTDQIMREVYHVDYQNFGYDYEI